jgi:hypothetical protein
MRKAVTLTFIIYIILLVAGCGQADFANVTVKSSRIESGDNGFLPASYLVLSMEIENLTDANLYIESTSPTNEKGEKHLWFVIKDGEGNEYKTTYYPEIESNIFPMSISPRTKATGEMAFEIPDNLSVVTLEVTQNAIGDGGSKVIFTQEVSL